MSRRLPPLQGILWRRVTRDEWTKAFIKVDGHRLAMFSDQDDSEPLFELALGKAMLTEIAITNESLPVSGRCHTAAIALFGDNPSSPTGVMDADLESGLWRPHSNDKIVLAAEDERDHAMWMRRLRKSCSNTLTPDLATTHTTSKPRSGITTSTADRSQKAPVSMILRPPTPAVTAHLFAPSTQDGNALLDRVHAARTVLDAATRDCITLTWTPSSDAVQGVRDLQICLVGLAVTNEDAASAAACDTSGADNTGLIETVAWLQNATTFAIYVSRVLGENGGGASGASCVERKALTTDAAVQLADLEDCLRQERLRRRVVERKGCFACVPASRVPYSYYARKVAL